MQALALPVETDKIAAFCRRWRIKEMSLFGSVLREDFGPESDVDVLVAFDEGGAMTFDNLPTMTEELSHIFGDREIDLVDRRLVRNPWRRHEILTHREILYAA